MDEHELLDRFAKSIEGIKISIAELKCRKYCEAHEETIEIMNKFISKVDEWMVTTKEYRVHQEEKLDEIMKMLSILPCEKRVGWWESVNKQLAFMWVILSAVSLSLMGLGIKAVFAR